MSVRIKLGTAPGGDSSFEVLGVGASEILVEAATVGEAFEQLVQCSTEAHTARQMLFDKEHKLRRIWNGFVNEKDIRFLQGLDTPIEDGDEIFITTAVCQIFLGVIAKGFKPTNR